MNKLLTKAKTAVQTIGQAVKEIAPEAALVIGVVGVVAGVVLACVETHDGIDEIVDDAQHKKDIIAETAKQSDEDDENGVEHEVYTKAQRGKDTMLVYFQMSKRLVKLYFPSMLVTGCSVMLILSGFNILKRRNATLACAYTSLAGAYETYRQRVREKIGIDEEYALCNGIKEEYVETVETDAKGKEKKVKVLQKTIADVSADPYSRIWDEVTTSMWRNDPVINIATLQGVQNYLNDLLNIKGFVLLNDAYDALGLERDDIGCVAGWVKGKGDGFISFGLTDNIAKEFMNCRAGRNGVLLNFNCIGYILDDVREITLRKKQLIEGV